VEARLEGGGRGLLTPSDGFLEVDRGGMPLHSKQL
jgi:hypothetical protein